MGVPHPPAIAKRLSGMHPAAMAGLSVRCPHYSQVHTACTHDTFRHQTSCSAYSCHVHVHVMDMICTCTLHTTYHVYMYVRSMLWLRYLAQRDPSNQRLTSSNSNVHTNTIRGTVSYSLMLPPTLLPGKPEKQYVSLSPSGTIYMYHQIPPWLPKYHVALTMAADGLPCSEILIKSFSFLPLRPIG